MTPEQYAVILHELRELRREVAELKASAAAGARSNGASGGAPVNSRGGGDGAVADDRDLDGDHGDPTIKYDPSARYWSGESFAGYRFSETAPEYLDAMAKYLDACAYMAEKDADEKKRKGAVYKRKDAARARGWAARLRRGWQPSGHAGGQANGRGAPAGGGYEQYAGAFNNGSDMDDDIPF
ncbi:hypothetical protein [Sorangium sp. So ce388]|uniref:hypothetical protein n=1 Tax=Sorangium sp. So ce388 TaxID=3133309 RepID=UPI003F5C07CC